MKVLEDAVAQVRVNFEQQRTDNDELKKTLETRDDELSEMRKQQDNDHKSASSCKTELVCPIFHICIGYETRSVAVRRLPFRKKFSGM